MIQRYFRKLKGLTDPEFFRDGDDYVFLDERSVLHRVDLSDIVEIDGEKQDRFTVDHIVLRIKLADGTEFWLDEGPVMGEFVEYARPRLPGFDVEAFARLYEIPFEQLTCVIFRREGLDVTESLYDESK